jgi:hypothetical protein
MYSESTDANLCEQIAEWQLILIYVWQESIKFLLLCLPSPLETTTKAYNLGGSLNVLK